MGRPQLCHARWWLHWWLHQQRKAAGEGRSRDEEVAGGVELVAIAPARPYPFLLLRLASAGTDMRRLILEQEAYRGVKGKNSPVPHWIKCVPFFGGGI